LKALEQQEVRQLRVSNFLQNCDGFADCFLDCQGS